MIITRRINISKITETNSKLHHCRPLSESEVLLIKMLRIMAKETEEEKVC